MFSLKNHFLYHLFAFQVSRLYNKNKLNERIQMRLDILLAQSSISRKDMKQALQRKAILVDNIPAQRLSQNVDTGLQQISLDNQIIVAPAHKYFMLNKPRGWVSANSDTNKKTVLELISPKDFNEKLYCIGRLDRDTAGLLLITDNGPLGFQLLHPQYHVNKTYYVEVNGFLDEQAIFEFKKGIRFLDGTLCKPAQLRIHSATFDFSSASVTISEGKFHQVKKMFLSVGVKVTYLKRTQFGEFHLDNSLQEGQYRPLNLQEYQTVKKYLEQSR